MKFFLYSFFMGFFFASPALSNVFTDKTFFTAGSFDRIYFSSDQTFVQQLETGWNKIKPGDFLRGTWIFDNDNNNLCINYLEPVTGYFCYEIVENKDSPGFRAIDSGGNENFIWQETRKGNWLFKSDFLVNIQNAPDENIFQVYDEKIAKYFVGKVITIRDGDLSYVPEPNVFYYKDKVTGEKIKSSYNVKNLTVYRYILGDVITLKSSMFTLGHEFLEDKPEQAYQYARKDIMYVQGEGIFDVVPIDDFPQKSFFLDIKDDEE